VHGRYVRGRSAVARGDERALQRRPLCNGVETCVPANPAANAKGCVTTNVPVPPPARAVRDLRRLRRGHEELPLTQKPAGASCNDGIAARQGTCAARRVVHRTATAACTATTCGALTSLARRSTSRRLAHDVVSLSGRRSLGRTRTVSTRRSIFGRWTRARAPGRVLNYTGRATRCTGRRSTRAWCPVSTTCSTTSVDSSNNVASPTDANDAFPRGLRSSRARS